jgi:CBS domain containing-hemolysin-like protein
LVLMLYPLVWISERLTRMISRGHSGHIFSREEFLAMARLGEESGHIEDSESRIIRNLFRFSLLKTADIMTPRTVISALPEERPLSEAMPEAVEQPFSRLPVFEGDIDHVTGFVLKDDLLLAEREGRGGEPLSSIRREIISVPESATLSILLEQLLAERQHIALAVDEHGGTAGLVTLEDILETLMGREIMDETDTVEDLRSLARKRWLHRRFAGAKS